MLDLGWFRARGFGIGAGLTALVLTVVTGILYLSVLFLQQHELHHALRTGAELLPLGAGILAGAAVSGRIAARLGLRAPVVTGLLLLAAGSAVLGLDQSGYLPVAISLAVIGLGAGLVLPVVTEAVMDGATQNAGGVAGATADAAIERGATLGIALLDSILSETYDGRVASRVSQLPSAAQDAARDSLLGAEAVAARLPVDQGQALVSAAGDAFVHGPGVAAIVAAGIALVSALLATRMPRQATITGQQPEDEATPIPPRAAPAAA
jgi:MFS family permease